MNTCGINGPKCKLGPLVTASNGAVGLQSLTQHSVVPTVPGDLQRLHGCWKWKVPADSDLMSQIILQKKINTYM